MIAAADSGAYWPGRPRAARYPGSACASVQNPPGRLASSRSAQSLRMDCRCSGMTTGAGTVLTIPSYCASAPAQFPVLMRRKPRIRASSRSCAFRAETVTSAPSTRSLRASSFQMRPKPQSRIRLPASGQDSCSSSSGSAASAVSSAFCSSSVSSFA